MDLLGGYDSNSDSDSEDIAPPKPPARRSAHASKADVTNQKKKGASNRKGKKLLKLQAVLPDHIWNQLSNGNAQQDSDEEDEDGKKNNPKTKSKAKTPKGPRLPGDNVDMTNLLDSLPKSKTGSTFLGGRSILGQDSNSTTIKAASAPSSSLGSAFVTSTVETVRTKKSVPTAVRDIHSSKVNTAVETVNEDGEEVADEQDETPKPRAMSLHPVASSMPSVPRPRMAAPPINNRARTAARAAASGYEQPAYPTLPIAQPHLQWQQHHPTATNTKRSRKRQMEQMLRQGNLEGVSSDVHLHGQDNVFEIPQDQQQASQQSHGIRVVPTSQYNPGAGAAAATVKISGKQRGKNQMNALLASAASLEAQRARNPLPQQNIHRSNAKRKYGW